MIAFGKWLLLSVLTIIIIIFSVNPNSAPFLPGLTLQKLLAALGGLFVIVLLVERVTEIFISIWRQSKSDQLKKELTLFKENSVESVQIEAKTKELTKYKSETKKLSLLLGFTISVIVCAAGIGLLREIIDVKNSNPHFIRGVDILLTSGLIAGGSDGFHQFFRALETFFQISQERMEQEHTKKA